MLAKFLNASYFLRVEHTKRIHGIAFITTVSYLLVAYCVYNSDHVSSFWLSLIGTLGIGFSCGMGESTTLGYIKALPSELVGFYGSGTGGSGILGAGVVLALAFIGIKDYILFLMASLIMVPYIYSF